MELVRVALATLLMVLSVPIVMVAVALLLALVWPPLFWGALLMSVVAGAWYAFSLKRLPRIQMTGLSEGAAELLGRYNHAWFAPGATKVLSGLLGGWQLVCIVTGIYFAFKMQWTSVGILVVAFLFLNFLSGLINPRAYIKHRQLNDEHDEIVQAYVEKRGVLENP
jgi:hypothetical protein